MYFVEALLEEKFEDTKGVIRSRKSKDRQYNYQKKKNKSSNDDLQNTTETTKDWLTRTPLKIKTLLPTTTKFIIFDHITT